MPDESLLRSAADNGDVGAMVELGVSLIGDLALVDELGALPPMRERIEEGTHWLVRAADAGQATAMRHLGHLARAQHRPDEQERWLHRAADSGDRPAFEYIWHGLLGRGERSEAVAYWERMMPRLAEAGDQAAIREVVRQLALNGRHDEAEHWYDQLGFAPTHDLTKIADTLADDGRVDEARRWLRHAVAAGDLVSLTWAGGFEARHGSPADAEHWYRQGAEAGALFAQLRLGNLLERRGHLEEAEMWLRRTGDYGTDELIAFLERRGRGEDAGHERQRKLAERQRQDRWDHSTVGASPDLSTVVTSVVITAAVLPFVQALAAKAAESTYSGVRTLLAKLAARYAGGRPAESVLVVVEDPTHDLKLHLRTDETDEALQTLVGLEPTIRDLTGSRRVRLAWDPATKTWRTPPG
jgi:TPR repeat protein